MNKASGRQVPQSSWASNLNCLGDANAAADLVPMDMDTMLTAAQSQTGLQDYGDDGFREALSILIDSLNNEAALNLTGRLIAKTEISRLLQSRLAIIDTEIRYPEIAQEKINEPLFIIGMGRTGSSILYECFMQDPTHRAPLAWEKKLPCFDAAVNQGYRAANPIDPIDWVNAEAKIMYEVDDSLRSKHETHAHLPEECSQLMAHEFQSGHFFSRNNVPSYALWNATNDVTPALNMHKRILKILQWQKRQVSKASGESNYQPQRWILKYGGHMACLPQLFAIYPDAKVIHTHRDPSVVVQSMTSLIASLRLMRSDSFDAGSAAEMLNAGMAKGLGKVIQERSDALVPTEQIADIHFSELMTDTITTIGKAYKALGMPFSDTAKTAIEDYLQARPRTQFGKHKYAYADSVDLERERLRFQDYMDHYAIAVES